LLVRLVCVLFVLLFVGWVSAIGKIDDITALNSLPTWVVLLGILGVLCSLGTILIVWNALKSWRTANKWFWAKLHDVALALACVGLVWFLLNWKLMNFNINF